MPGGEEWMRPIDSAILEFFSNHDIIINPSSLAVNIGYDAGYVADRCQILTSHDFLEAHDGPKYELSEEGRANLDELTS